MSVVKNCGIAVRVIFGVQPSHLSCLSSDVVMLMDVVDGVQ